MCRGRPRRTGIRWEDYNLRHRLMVTTGNAVVAARYDVAAGDPLRPVCHIRLVSRHCGDPNAPICAIGSCHTTSRVGKANGRRLLWGMTLGGGSLSQPWWGRLSEDSVGQTPRLRAPLPFHLAMTSTISRLILSVPVPIPAPVCGRWETCGRKAATGRHDRNDPYGRLTFSPLLQEPGNR